MREVFEYSLKGAADLLTEQLELAKAMEHAVQVSYRPVLSLNFRVLLSCIFLSLGLILITLKESNSHRWLRPVALTACPPSNSP